MALQGWPYTNIHNLNLDWLLCRMKELSKEIQDFTLYVPHFDDRDNSKWNNQYTYEPNTLVLYDNAIYAAKKHVPAGISIADEEYWLKLEDFNLPENPYVIVTPEEYGAVGDGEADDTEAIQRCIDRNPNSIIAFRKPVYNVSDTIYTYGSAGGQLLLLGSSELRFVGTAAQNQPVLQIGHDPFDSGRDSACKIIGGVINANDIAPIGIFVNRPHTVIQDCKIISFSKYGIQVGTDSSNRSLGVSISHAKIFIATASTQGWSNVNDAYGIALLEPDGILNDIDINRCKGGIYQRSGGYLISNVHITAQYRSQQTNIALTYGIYYDPVSPSTPGFDEFTNIYFDNVKYCLYNAVVSKRYISIANGAYYNSGNQQTAIDTAYLMGGQNNGGLSVSGFNAVSANGRTAFMTGDYNYVNLSQSLTRNKEQFNHIRATYDPAIPDYIAPNYYSNGEHFIAFSSAMGGRLPDAGKVLRIGCIIYSKVTNPYHAELNIWGGRHTYKKALIPFNADSTISKPILVDFSYDTQTDFGYVMFGAPEDVVLNGNTYAKADILLKPRNSALPITMSLTLPSGLIFIRTPDSTAYVDAPADISTAFKIGYDATETPSSVAEANAYTDAQLANYVPKSDLPLSIENGGSGQRATITVVLPAESLLKCTSDTGVRVTHWGPIYLVDGRITITDATSDAAGGLVRVIQDVVNLPITRQRRGFTAVNQTKGTVIQLVASSNSILFRASDINIGDSIAINITSD